MNTPLVLEQIYDASISKVSQALTDENRMKAWYFPQIIKFEPIKGFEFVFSNDRSPYKKSGVLQGLKLFNKEGKTCLRVTHTGLDSFPTDAHFARHRFENGWKQLLTSLKGKLQNWIITLLNNFRPFIICCLLTHK